MSVEGWIAGGIGEWAGIKIGWEGFGCWNVIWLGAGVVICDTRVRVSQHKSGTEDADHAQPTSEMRERSRG